MSIINDIAQEVLPALQPLLEAAGAAAGVALAKWMHTRSKNEAVQGILDRLTMTVETVVAETEQTFVKKLGEGPMSADQAKQALDAALASLKTHLGQKGLKELEFIFPPAQLEQILVSYIEAQVHVSKGGTS